MTKLDFNLAKYIMFLIASKAQITKCSEDEIDIAWGEERQTNCLNMPLK